MKNKALVLALTASFVVPAVTFAAEYDGTKLSSHLGPTYQDVESVDKVAKETAGDQSIKRLQDEPNADSQKRQALLNRSKKQKKEDAKNPDAAQVNTQALPVIVYGDKVIYHEETGDFEALGKVRIYQGNQKMYTTKAEGNIKTGDVFLNQGGRLVDDGTVTNGKWMHYNFLNKNGNLKKLDGSNGVDFYEAESGTMYPDRIELDQGAATTRCVAKEHTHCVDVKADKVIIYPNDKIIAYGVKVYVKGKHIYSRDRWINDLTKEDNRNSLIPRIGYSKDHGFEVEYTYKQPLSDKNQAAAELKYYSKIGWRPLFSDVQDEKNFYVKIQQGHTEDSDNNWIKKERDVTVGYKSHKFTDKLPLNYSAYASHGLWSDKYRRSWHTETGIFLTHDPLHWGDHNPVTLNLGTGYKITKESVNDSTTKTMLYSATLRKPLDYGWNTWLGYYWEKNENNLFAYNLPDMARELQLGVSKRFDAMNNLTFITRYDEGKSNIYEYVWRYDHFFCCWRLGLEFRDKKYNNEKEWSINYDLYRW